MSHTNTLARVTWSGCRGVGLLARDVSTSPINLAFGHPSQVVTLHNLIGPSPVFDDFALTFQKHNIRDLLTVELPDGTRPVDHRVCLLFQLSSVVGEGGFRIVSDARLTVMPR